MSFPQHCQNHIILTPQLHRKWTIYSHPKHWRHGGCAWRTVRGSINFISRAHLTSDLSLWPHSLSHPCCCLCLLCCKCIHIQSRQRTLTVLFCLDTWAGTITPKLLGKPRTGADCWELRPMPKPQLPGVGVWRAAAVTSGAFCTSWPPGYFVDVRRPYISVIAPACDLCWCRGFRLLVCLPKHTTESGDEMFLEHMGKHAHEVCICVSVCTQWAAGLEAPHQSARLCFCSCTSSCFGPDSHIRCFTASSSISLSSLLVPFHPWSRGLTCPGFSSPPEFLEFMPTTRGNANPTRLDGPVTLSLPPPHPAYPFDDAMTLVRLSGLPCFLHSEPKSN